MILSAKRDEKIKPQLYSCYLEGEGRKMVASGVDPLDALLSCYFLSELDSKIPKGKGKWI